MLSRRLRMTVVMALLGASAFAQGASSPEPRVASERVDAPALVADLRTLSADDMQGRKMGTPGGENARTYLVSRFKDAGLATLQGGTYVFPFTSASGVAGSNVVGLVRGARAPGRFIVVSAHYDHVGVQNGVIFNGADDNASGAAALIGIAKYFTARPPESSLLIVAFDGEEQGLLGSRAFVRAPPVYPESIVIDLNIDMIGRETRNRLFVAGTRLQPFLKPYIDRVAATARVNLIAGHDDPANRRMDDWTSESDQFSFLVAGIPALYFGVEDDGQHHRPTDDFETMTLDFYIRAVETIVAAIREIDAHADEFAGRRISRQ